MCGSVRGAQTVDDILYLEDLLLKTMRVTKKEGRGPAEV